MSDLIEILIRVRDEATKAIDKTKNALNETSEAEKKVGESEGLRTLGHNAKFAESRLESLAVSARQASQVLLHMRRLAFVSTAIFMVGRAAQAVIGTAIKFQDGLVNVSKTTNITGQALVKFGEGITELSTILPIPTDQLLEIAAAAGQLGISGSANLLKFTDVVGKLTRVTKLTGEEAATSIARIMNVTGESISLVDRFGSTLDALGNSFAANEAEITRGATYMARQLAPFGVMSRQLLGLSSTLKAMGLQAQIASTTVGRVFLVMNKAVSLGGSSLKELARMTGLSASQFSKMFKDNSMQAFLKFLYGLRKAGSGAQVVLDKLNLTMVQGTGVLLTLAKNVGMVKGALKEANVAWAANTTLNEVFSIFARSASARWQIFGNVLTSVATKIGNDILPPLSELADKLSKIVLDFEKTETFTFASKGLGDSIKGISNNLGGIGKVLEFLLAGAMVKVITLLARMSLSLLGLGAVARASMLKVVSLGGVLDAFPAVAIAAWASWDVGKWLNKKFEFIRVFSTWLARSFLQGWITYRAIIERAVANFVFVVTNPLETLKVQILNWLLDIKGILDKVPNQFQDKVIKMAKRGINGLITALKPVSSAVEDYQKHIADINKREAEALAQNLGRYRTLIGLARMSKKELAALQVPIKVIPRPDLANRLNEVGDTQHTVVPGSGTPMLSKQQAKAIKQATLLIQMANLQTAAYEKGGNEQKRLLNIQHKILAVQRLRTQLLVANVDDSEVNKLTKSYGNVLEKLYAIKRAQKELKKELVEQGKASKVLDTLDPTRVTNREIAAKLKLQREGYLSKKQAEAAISKIKEDVGGITQYSIQAARSIQSAFANFLFDPMKKGFAGMLMDFANVLRQMIAQVAAAQLAKAMFGANFATTGTMGGWGGKLGKAISTELSSIFHSGGVVGTGSGTSRLVPESAFFGAPRYHSGGIAGLLPNEVPAILQRGERVIPAGVAIGSPVKVEVINNTGQPVETQKTNERGIDVTRIVVGAVASDVRSGGEVARAMSQVFGVRRQGVSRG